MIRKRDMIRLTVYSIVTIIGYYGAKYFFPTEEDRINRNKNKPQPKLPDGAIIKDPLTIEGGFLKPNDFFKKFFANNSKYILIATLVLSLTTLGDRYKQAIAEILKEASPAVTAIPIPLIKNLLHGIGTLDTRELLNVLKEGLLSNELSLDDKILLIKKTFVGLALSAKTAGVRKKLILTAILIVLSIGFTNGPAFGGIFLVLQDILTKIGFKRATAEYILDLYKEYNAPIPKELYDLLKSVGSKAIEN